mmetsp:Transcript_836/g.1377  ORF Transcript_836/g.1377 Transcript_836/m.1377 type:complete len:120 (+) Transcript_836:14-373(+)
MEGELEVRDPNDVTGATTEMLSKVSQYLAGEVDLSVEDYRLLRSMNMAAADKYSEMADYAAGLVAFAEQLQSKSADILPQLEQISVLSDQVIELEAAVQQLDSYSKRLEAKFVSLVESL